MGCAVLERDQHLVHQRHGQVGRHQAGGGGQPASARSPAAAGPVGPGKAPQAQQRPGRRRALLSTPESSPGSVLCPRRLSAAPRLLAFERRDELQRLALAPSVKRQAPAARWASPVPGVPTPAWSACRDQAGSPAARPASRSPASAPAADALSRPPGLARIEGPRLQVNRQRRQTFRPEPVARNSLSRAAAGSAGARQVEVGHGGHSRRNSAAVGMRQASA